MSFARILQGLYQFISRTGIQNTRLGRSLFLRCYFLYKKCFECELAQILSLISSHLPTGHVLDIGANVGYTSVVFSSVLKETYKVFAFEPDPTNLSLLQKVLSSRLPPERYEIVGAAVGATDEIIDLWVNRDHPADNRVVSGELQPPSTDTIQVPKRSLDSFILERQISSEIALIKIDVQGYEYAVIEGASKFLQEVPQVFLFLEWEPMGMKELGGDVSLLLTRLSEFGFIPHRLSQSKLVELSYQELENFQQSSRYDYMDVLFSKKSLALNEGAHV